MTGFFPSFRTNWIISQVYATPKSESTLVPAFKPGTRLEGEGGGGGDIRRREPPPPTVRKRVREWMSTMDLRGLSIRSLDHWDLLLPEKKGLKTVFLCFWSLTE